MTAKPEARLIPRLVQSEPAIEWQDYARIEPGIYPAYCLWAKHYRDPGFKRWTCLLRFDVLAADLVRVIARVPFWMNLGEGAKPHASRRGNYLPEWVRANGGPPVRNDRLSPKVFRQRMARVQVRDTEKSAAPYSVIQRIVVWETGPLLRVTQSSSHTVKEGTG
jgi:hypothetical protein